jgi:hypothetical protein
MWVFLSGAFLSIVQDKQKPERLLVRARRADDIERVFNTKRVRETPAGDYRFRASIPRAIVADTIRAEVAGISYPNFKSSVQDADRRYLNVYVPLARTPHAAASPSLGAGTGGAASQTPSGAGESHSAQQEDGRAPVVLTA